MSQQQRAAIDALLRGAPYDPSASIADERVTYAQTQTKPLPEVVTARSTTLGGRPALDLQIPAPTGPAVLLYLSGAAQLIASGAISRLQPDSSAIGAYSSWVRPDTSGRNRFDSSRRRASALSSSTTGGTEWSSGPAFAR